MFGEKRLPWLALAEVINLFYDEIVKAHRVERETNIRNRVRAGTKGTANLQNPNRKGRERREGGGGEEEEKKEASKTASWTKIRMGECRHRGH